MVSMRPTISQGFSNASLRGTYAFAAVGRGGQMPTAYLGVFDFDGEGNLSGTGLINLPEAEFGIRQVVPFTAKGSYGIDADGSGYGSTRITSTFPNGAARETNTVVLVTRAEVADGIPLVQEMSLMQTELEPVTGSLFMYSAFRRPEGAVFTPASFQGVYGGPGIAQNGQTPACAIGIGAVNFDGEGNFTGVDIQNLPGGTLHERQVPSFDTPHGRYLIEENGIGTIIGNNEGQARVVVTRAMVANDRTTALEYFFINTDLVPTTASFVTTYITKRIA